MGTAYIVDAVRTAGGRRDGALKDWHPADLGAAVLNALVERTAVDPAAYRIGAEAVWLADQRDRARAIDVPALVVCGAEDKVTPPALSEELAAMIPGAKLEMIPGAGHISNLERPAEFNRIVEEFIGNG
jgi:3-oxoadipate enol-lactonase